MAADTESWTKTSVDELKAGDYIRVDRRWFDHPFERRMFRIGSAKDIEALRQSLLKQVFVDRGEASAGGELPQSVEPAQASAPAQAASAAAAADDASSPEKQRRPDVALTPEELRELGAEMEPQARAAPAPAPVDEEALRRQREREAARLAEQREALAAARAREEVTRERAQEMFALLSAGHWDSAGAAASFIDYLVAILNNSTAPLAPMAPAMPRGSTTRLALLGSDAVWLAGTIGKRMGLDSEALRALVEAAVTHLAGFSRLPPNLRDEQPGEARPGTTLARYPDYSAAIIEQCGGFSAQALRIVREHRERLDGTGFPRGLKGDQIHPSALILGAVRELQIRCANSAVSPAVALAEIHKGLRAAYGSTIVNHLVSAVLLIPVGTYVQLSDGSVARVVKINESARLSPVVESFGPNAQLGSPQVIDLSRRPGLFIVRALDTSKLPPRLFDTVRSKTKPAAPAAVTPEPEKKPAPATAPVVVMGAPREAVSKRAGEGAPGDKLPQASGA